MELYLIIMFQNDNCKDGINLKQIVATSRNIRECDIDAHFGDLASALSKFNMDDLDSIKDDLIEVFGPQVITFYDIFREIKNDAGQGIRVSDALDMVSCERNVWKFHIFLIFHFSLLSGKLFY